MIKSWPHIIVRQIGQIASSLRSGADGTVITGTAGTNGNLATWNADGDIIDGGAVPSEGPSQATQAAIEAETDEDTYIPPDLARNIPGAAKAYCTVGGNGTLQADSYNIDFTQKDATGEYTVSFDVNFGNTNYTCVIIAQSTNATINGTVNTPAVDRIEMKFVTGSGTAVDVEFHLVAFGDSL